jgi:mono/diheme cytochrome c family protein
MNPDQNPPPAPGNIPDPYPIPPRRPGVGDITPRDPREYIEPGEAHRPIKLLYVTFLVTLFSWGGFYFQRYSAGYHPLGYDEYSSGPGGVKSNVVQNIDPYTLGKRIFNENCAKCHQPDGLGLPGQYPPLVGSEWPLAPGPARMIRIVLDGMTGPIKVKGLDYNNNMTPWRDVFNDQQIAAVITFVRTQKDWGHAASPVTPEEVATIRKKTKDRPAIGPWTANELLAIPEVEPQP